MVEHDTLPLAAVNSIFPQIFPGRLVATRVNRLTNRPSVGRAVWFNSNYRRTLDVETKKRHQIDWNI